MARPTNAKRRVRQIKARTCEIEETAFFTFPMQDLWVCRISPKRHSEPINGFMLRDESTFFRLCNNNIIHKKLAPLASRMK